MSASADRLPHIDEHTAVVDADPAASWDALLRVAEAFGSSGATPRFARLLGCADLEASGPRPLAAGSAFPGFHVEVAERPLELALLGSHRFSDYALVFRLDDLGDGCTRLRAETRAEFPGLKGRVYRAMVIGTRGHVLVTRRLLNAAKRRAERVYSAGS
ncbi:MAG: SRPBCC family protein [Solirubrobacterales bacterium]